MLEINSSEWGRFPHATFEPCDETALREAIRLDIYDGMDSIGQELLGHKARPE